MRLSNIITLAAAFMASAVYAQDSDTAPVDAGSSIGSSGRPLLPNTYMVELDASVVDKQAFVSEKLAAANVDVSKIDFRVDVANLISFTLPQDDANDKKVESIGAAKAFKVGLIAHPNAEETAITEEFDVSAYTNEKFHALTGVNEARKAFKLSGKGIKVAVIDSGVDYLHPALGGGFGPGFKVSYGWDLVGDAYSLRNQKTVEDPDPMDNCSASSHGTHVAGIVGAFAYNMAAPFQPPVDFTGVAPNVTLGAYRVFGCEADYTSEDIIVKAVYKAQADGSHIINMSLGGGPQYNDGVDAYAVEQVSKAGVIVLSSNGNSQAAGLMVAGSPGISRGGFGVASFDNAGVPQATLFANNAPFTYSIGGSNGNFKFDLPYDVLANDITALDRDEQNDGLTPLNPPVNATGKALLIRWGDSLQSANRCNYAARAGAAACILYSNGPTIPSIAGSALIPSLATTREAGAAIVAKLKAGQKVSLVVTTKQTMGDLATGGTVSSFSSPGLDPDLFVKPEIGGIGGQVLSTNSRFASRNSKFVYGLKSGTSMSSPYTAGAMALLLEAKGVGNVDFKAAQTLLMNTAEPKRIFNSPLVDSVTRQGAGLINIYKAVTTKTLVEPPVLHLNDTKYTKQHYTITITNQNTVPVSYTLETLGAAMATGFVAGDDALQSIANTSFTPDYATVKFARNNQRVDSLNFTIAAGDSKNVNVHFTAPSTAVAGLFPVYSGFIQLSSVDGAAKKIVASVPFAGMVGSWRDAPVWSRNSWVYTNRFLKTNYNTAANVTATTGFFADLKFNPLRTSAPYSVVNATKGGIVLPIASTTSRYAKIELIFAGDAAQKAKLPSSIRHKTPLGFLSGQQYNWDDNILDPKIQPMILRQVARNNPTAVQGVNPPAYWQWNGKVTANTTSSEGAIAVPEGLYRVKISGLLHFGRVGATGDSNYDVVTSPVFQLVY
ncbi:hypothetical protein HDU97_004425 [Phlyctochytrium planicorne]|nr:hypothetical protein HDU97_004425 [Phlyctochytrium planicorne]